GDNVKRAFQAVISLRAQLRVCLNEIVKVLNAPTKDDAKDSKDNKDTPDAKAEKDNKDSKDNKDNPDAKQDKDNKDGKEDKDSKDDNDKDPKEGQKDHMGAVEKKDEDLPPFGGSGRFGDPRPEMGPPVAGLAPAADLRPDGLRLFIAPDERPALGQRALRQPR